MGGYVILKSNGAQLSYAKVENAYNKTNGYNGKPLPEIQTGTREFFELYLNHGIGDSLTGTIKNDSYYYAYLPDSTVEETMSYSANPDVALICCDSNVHAVLEKNLGIVAANFFTGKCDDIVKIDPAYSNITAVESINAETPACVMISKDGGDKYIISVSDPTGTYSRTDLTVQIAGVTKILSKDENVCVTLKDGVISATVNTEKRLRKTYTFVVS
jgi:hypothetical protein